MAELPSIPNRIAHITAPTPMVSRADIEAPFTALAKSLNTAGEVVSEEIAIPLAERAGHEAVRVGPDGMPVVERGPVPIVGDAGKAFRRAASFTYLARLQPQIESGLADLRLKFPNDPQGFKIASTEYTKNVLAQQPDPLLRAPVEKIALETASQNYRTLSVQADHTNVTNALTALQSRLVAINEKGASIARQLGTDVPQYVGLHADRAAIYDELVKDKRYNFPPERAQQELAENRDRDVMQGVIGQTVSFYQSKRNAVEAKRFLMDAAWGPGSENLRLSPQKRDALVAEGVKALESRSIEDKEGQTAFRASVTQYSANLQHAPHSFDDIVHNTMVAQARSIGDTKTVAELDAARVMVPIWRAVRGLPAAEAVEAVGAMSRGVVPGVPGLEGRLINRESRGNPGIVNPYGFAGLYQFGAPRLATMGVYTPGAGEDLNAWNDTPKDAPGKWSGVFNIPGFPNVKSIDDFRASPAAQKAAFDIHRGRMDKEISELGLEQYEGKVVGGVPITREGLYAMIHLGGARGAQRALSGGVNARDANDTSVLDYARLGLPGELEPGSSVFRAANPFVQKLFMSTVAELRQQQARHAEHMATDFTERLVKRREAVTAEEAQTFVASAIGAGRLDLLDKVKPAFKAYDEWAGQYRDGQSPSVAALDAQIRAVTAAGVADPITRGTLHNLSTMVQGGAEALRKDPLKEGAARGWIAPVNPLNPQNPQAAAAELADRDRKGKLVRGHDQEVGPLSVILDGEGQGVIGALTQGDPKTAATMLATMQQALSPETLKATLSSDPMKQALTGMMKTYDPVRLNAAMSTLDKFWRDDPIGFKQAFGEETLKRLQVWAAWRNSHTPSEIAVRFKWADDPANVEARKRLGELADGEAKKIHPGDVATAIYAVDHPTLARLPFTGPSAPSDGFQAEVLKAEFDGLYREFRGYGVDADEAKKQAAGRLKTIWGESAVQGGRVMRHPPERYYDAVDGSRTWMVADLERALTATLGKPRTVSKRTDLGIVTSENWSYKILSDAQTDQDIAAGRKPSYVVSVTNAETGKNDVPLDPAGQPMRFRWDDAPHLAASRKRFTDSREAARWFFGDNPRETFMREPGINLGSDIEAEMQALDRQERGLEASGLSGTFKQAQQARIAKRRGELERLVGDPAEGGDPSGGAQRFGNTDASTIDFVGQHNFDLPYDKMRQSQNVEDLSDPWAAGPHAMNIAKSAANLVLGSIKSALPANAGEFNNDIESAAQAIKSEGGKERARAAIMPTITALENVLSGEDMRAMYGDDPNGPPVKIDSTKAAQRARWKRLEKLLFGGG